MDHGSVPLPRYASGTGEVRSTGGVSEGTDTHHIRYGCRKLDVEADRTQDFASDPVITLPRDYQATLVFHTQTSFIISRKGPLSSGIGI